MAWMAWVYLVVVADLDTNQGVFDEVARSLGGAFYRRQSSLGHFGLLWVEWLPNIEIVSVV